MILTKPENKSGVEFLPGSSRPIGTPDLIWAQGARTGGRPRRRGAGGHGEYVERLSELKPALERAFAADGPALVNVKIGQSDFRKNALAI